MKFVVLMILMLAISCSNNKPVNKPREEPQPPTSHELKPIPVIKDADISSPVTLWATWYNSPVFKQDPSGVIVRDLKGRSLGVKLSRKDWCTMAMEGTGFIDGKTYNYAGTSNSHKVRCSHRASGRVKFHVTSFPYGAGNKNNPLVPFHSVACDQKRFKFGQVFYIPDAVGTILPDGTKHDGMFRCDDVGGLIKGNHLDIFIGKLRSNLFKKFVHSNKNKTFKAYLQ